MSVLIKGGRVITAADDYVADIFVEDERISLIGESLDVAADTRDRRVRASTCCRARSIRTRTSTCRSAARRRSTTSSRASARPRAAARPATSTSASRRRARASRDALADWKSKAEGKQLIDMGYHIAVTDLKEGGSLEELATLPDQGITSYKLFMAYKGALMVDDETLFKTMEVAAETGALVMVHAENGDAIDVLVKKALAEGKTEPEVPRADAAARDRGRGDEPGDPARARRRLRRSTSSTSPARSRSSRSCSRARRAGTSGARPARSTSSSTTRSSSGRTSRARSTSTRRRRATRRTRTCSGTPSARDIAQRDLDRPLRLPLGRAEGARPGRLLEDPERRARASRTGCT